MKLAEALEKFKACKRATWDNGMFIYIGASGYLAKSSGVFLTLEDIKAEDWVENRNPK